MKSLKDEIHATLRARAARALADVNLPPAKVKTPVEEPVKKPAKEPAKAPVKVPIRASERRIIQIGQEPPVLPPQPQRRRPHQKGPDDGVIIQLRQPEQPEPVKPEAPPARAPEPAPAPATEAPAEPEEEQEAGLEDHTRFFIGIAKTNGVPLSALAYYVQKCRVTAEYLGCWTAKELGEQIGLGHQRIRQLLQQAQAEEVRLLDFERTTKGFKIWLTPTFAQWLKIKTRRSKELAKTIEGYQSPFQHLHAEGRYRLSTARQYGYTGSVLLELLDPEPREVTILEDPEPPDRVKFKLQTITVPTACRLFPWMHPKTVRRTLRKLVEAEWLECISVKSPRYREVRHDDYDFWREEVPESARGEEIYALAKSRWTLKKPRTKVIDSGTKVIDPGTLL